ncbi:MAG: hypothetical protein EXR58_04105 [Chloroflexi bacterium]|nr:hypothetical protein [Chloroflexota bacterium]
MTAELPLAEAGLPPEIPTPGDPMVQPPAQGLSWGRGMVRRVPRPGRLRIPIRPPRPTWTAAALVATLLLAAGLRLIGLDWDSGHHLHPDERFITSVASALQLPALSQYFDTTKSPFNPNGLPNTNYVYGTLPLYAARLLGGAIQGIAIAMAPGPVFEKLRLMGQYDGIYLVGRILSAGYDLATIVFIFLIARRLYDPKVAVLAAVLAALTVLQIQASHFFTVETSLTLLVTIAMYFGLRAAQSGRLLDWSMLGLATGLAAASKVTALMLGAIFLTAGALLWYRAARLDAYERRRFLAEDLLTGLFVAGGLAFSVFRLAQPYTFAGPGIFDLRPDSRWMEVFSAFQRIGTGDADVPFNDSWAGAIPYVWQLREMTMWGMGPALALASWVGFAWAALQTIGNPRRYHLLILPLLWIGVNFAYWGIQFTKLMRYMLPIYPFLTIFAAALLIAAWQWSRSHQRIAARVLVVGVVGWTAFYALAFSSIYTRPHSRMAASAWIYTNVPAGATLGTEHWDDRLPLGLPGDNPDRYRYVEFNNYDPDTPEKRNQLLTHLDQTDYIVLTSNRLYGSIPKLPQRYPVSTRYYQALFGGELGFESVAEFTSRPGLFGLELNDDDSEESFTVYDHPKVNIYHKTDTYSATTARQLLEAVSLNEVVQGLRPKFATSGGLLMDEAERLATQSGGTWSDMFNRESLANRLPLPVWYLTLEVLGLLALPLTWFLCRHLADGGYALAKTLALLTIAYLPWLLASLRIIPYTQGAIGLAALFLAAMSSLVLAKHWAHFRADLSSQRLTIVLTEALFAVAFLGFVALRSANPDLWHSAYGGEKPMDFAYLNAVMKSTWFPPYDPWFAVGYINYYYFGFVIVGSLSKLTGVLPWVAYNLAIPTIAALTATSVASVVFNILVHRQGAPPTRQLWAWAGGLLGAYFAVAAGNLQGILQVLQRLASLGPASGPTSIGPVDGFLRVIGGTVALIMSFGQGLPPWSFDFWAPTRIINRESEITEFPYFTFLYGDLHAHMIAMPLGIFAIALALNLVRQPNWIPNLSGKSPPAAFTAIARAIVSPGGATLIVGAVMIGVIRMTNSWDYPTYLGLIAASLLLAEARRRPRHWPTVFARGLGLAAAVALISELVVTPYIRQNVLFYSGVERSTAHTPLGDFTLIMGAFLACLGLYAGFRLWALRERLAQGLLFGVGALGSGAAPLSATASHLTMQWRSPASTAWVVLGTLSSFTGLALLASDLPVGGVAVLGVGVLAIITTLGNPSIGTRFAFLLVATGLAVTAGVDLIVLSGAGRMNTVFKFYLQAWFLFSIASAVGLTLLARRAWRSPWLLRGPRAVWAIGLSATLAITLLYPLLATPSKVQQRFTPLPPSLDGMAFMEVSRYTNHDGTDVLMKDDFPAINWMLDNIEGTPVIVEGLGDLYRWTSRVSIYTGLPTVRGWDFHQKQQRGDFAAMVDTRTRDVETIYRSESPAEVQALLDKYRVEYVYVGGQEKALYPPSGLAKFDQMLGSRLDRVYQAGAVTIYRVLR